MSMLGSLFARAQARSLIPLVYVGVVRSPGLLRFVEDGHVASLFPSPATAIARQADVLVVVGDVTHKIAPELLRTHAKIAQPSFVLHLTSSIDATPGYGLVRNVAELLPIDVVVRGDPPTTVQLKGALDALARVVRDQRPKTGAS